MEDVILSILKINEPENATSEYSNKIMCFSKNDKKYSLNEKDDPYFKIINYYYQTDDLKKMKKYSKILLGENEEFGLALLGFYYQIKNKLDRARDLFIQGVEKDYTFVMYQYAWFCFENKEYDEMKKNYLKCIEKGDAFSMYMLGYYYIEIEKNYAEMTKYFKMAIDSPDHPSNLRIGPMAKMIGHYYAAIDDEENTLKYYEMAVDNGDKSAIVCTGIYYRSVGNYADMIKNYLANIFVNEDVQSMYELGVYYNEIGRYDEMEFFYYMAAIKNHSAAMYKLGFYYQTTGDSEEMIKYYLMAGEHRHAIAMNNLGVYCGQMGDYDNMKKYLELSIEYGDIAAYLNLAVCYEMMKNIDKMKECYLMAEEKGNSKGYIELGKYYSNNDNSEEAKKYFQMAIDKGNNYGLFEMMIHYATKEKDFIKSMLYAHKCVEKKMPINYENVISLYFEDAWDTYNKSMHEISNQLYLNDIKTDEECCVCYEQAQIVTLCKHYYCKVCCNKMFINDTKPCAICRFGEN